VYNIAFRKCITQHMVVISRAPLPVKKLACGDWEKREGLKKLSKHRLTRNPLG